MVTAQASLTSTLSTSNSQHQHHPALDRPAATLLPSSFRAGRAETARVTQALMISMQFLKPIRSYIRPHTILQAPLQMLVNIPMLAWKVSEVTRSCPYDFCQLIRRPWVTLTEKKPNQI